jgi:hypothetical protein
MEAAKQILNGTAKISAIRYSQQCLLCENTRGLPEGMHYCNTPWVCEECKEAIAFIKDFKASLKQQDSKIPSQGLPNIKIIPL